MHFSFQGTLAPFGVSIREKDKVSPDFEYSMIPDKMFTSSRKDGGNDAKSSRLYGNGAWCAPTDNQQDYIQVHHFRSSNS